MTAYLARPPSGGTHSPLMATFRPPIERRTDWVNPIMMAALAVTGVFFIKSAQAYTDGTQWHSQIAWLVLGAALYVAMGRVDYHVWSRHALGVYALSVLLLILVLTPLGQVRGGAQAGEGARRWLGFHSYTIQPSEFAKVGTLIMLASILARSELGTVRESLEMLGKAALAVVIPIVLIFRQPDLGSSLAFFPMVFALLYVSNLSARFFVTVFVIFLIGLGVVYADMQNYLHYLQSHHLQDVVVAGQVQGKEVVDNNTPDYQKYLQTWKTQNYQRYQNDHSLPDGAAGGMDSPDFQQYLQTNHLEPQHLTAQDAMQYGAYEKTSLLPLKTYQLNRILSFLEPEVADPQGNGATWNLKQSLIAVGSGGLAGKGYENGTQARLGYLPHNVAISDFIMSVFLEETGFIGGVAVIGLFAILLGNTLRIAGLARDRFGQLLCVGAAVVFMVHVFVNIGMVQGLMPVKGIPLPLMSSGGSFVLTCCLLMGLVQSVYRHRREAV